MSEVPPCEQEGDAGAERVAGGGGEVADAAFSSPVVHDMDALWNTTVYPHYTYICIYNTYTDTCRYMKIYIYTDIHIYTYIYR